MKKILIVAEYGILNGGERSLLAILPNLQRRNWEFVALLPADSEFTSALNDLRIPTVPLIKCDNRGNRLQQPELRQQLADQFRSVQPDLIHCNSLATSRWCGPVAQQCGIPAVGYLRDIINVSRRAVSDINQLKRIICVSQATRNWHVERGIESAQSRVIHNGVDLEKFSPRDSNVAINPPAKIRRELGIAAKSPLLLFVGQLGMRKGVDTLLAAFEIIAATQGESHLLIVGERNSTKQEAIEFEIELQKKSNSSAFSSQIHWLGRRHDVADLMRAATVLIHPARQEPLGRVLLEAAASGLPMVTSDVGGSAEILTELEPYELLQPLDPVPIAKRVIRLLHHSDQRQTISLELRIVAETKFAVETCAVAVDQVYRELLDY